MQSMSTLIMMMRRRREKKTTVMTKVTEGEEKEEAAVLAEFPVLRSVFVMYGLVGQSFTIVLQ